MVSIMGQIVFLKNKGKETLKVKKHLNTEHPEYTVIVLKGKKKKYTKSRK